MEVEATLRTPLQMRLLEAVVPPRVVAALPILVAAVAGLAAMAKVLVLLLVIATPTTPGVLHLLQMHLVDNLGPSDTKLVTLPTCAGTDLMRILSLILTLMVGHLPPTLLIQIGISTPAPQITSRVN
jgi:hypothetical protein